MFFPFHVHVPSCRRLSVRHRLWCVFFYKRHRAWLFKFNVPLPKEIIARLIDGISIYNTHIDHLWLSFNSLPFAPLVGISLALVTMYIGAMPCSFFRRECSHHFTTALLAVHNPRYHLPVTIISSTTARNLPLQCQSGLSLFLLSENPCRDKLDFRL